MHESELTKSTYSAPQGPAFQDLALTPGAVNSGELRRRFDVIAFPQLGIKYTGNDADGHAVPAAAVSV